MNQASQSGDHRLEQLKAFMERHVYPNEAAYRQALGTGSGRFDLVPLMEELRLLARRQGLWNLFIHRQHGRFCRTGGLSHLEYAPLAEEMGRVPWASEIFNCNAPNTGNMEVLMKYGTPEQQDEWLKPMLEGEFGSSYAMTEPHVASSDATNMQLQIRKDRGNWILNGRKWFITGAMYARTRLFIVMGKTDPDNPDRHRQQSQVLVPADAPGITIVRPLTTLGYDDAPIGHAEVLFQDVSVPERNILLEPGRGFEIAQGRLGAGRVHHCMRLVGAAQRSLELACKRATERTAFGNPLSENQSVREDMSSCFSETSMARLLVHETCRKMDHLGTREARDLIASSKTCVPVMVQTIIDRCMQIHGASGLTDDFFMAEAFNYARWCRQADGPDQVHHMALGKQVIKRYGSAAG